MPDSRTIVVPLTWTQKPAGSTPAPVSTAAPVITGVRTWTAVWSLLTWWDDPKRTSELDRLHRGDAAAQTSVVHLDKVVADRVFQGTLQVGKASCMLSIAKKDRDSMLFASVPLPAAPQLQWADVVTAELQTMEPAGDLQASLVLTVERPAAENGTQPRQETPVVVQTQQGTPVVVQTRDTGGLHRNDVARVQSQSGQLGMPLTDAMLQAAHHHDRVHQSTDGVLVVGDTGRGNLDPGQGKVVTLEMPIEMPKDKSWRHLVQIDLCSPGWGVERILVGGVALHVLPEIVREPRPLHLGAGDDLTLAPGERVDVHVRRLAGEAGRCVLAGVLAERPEPLAVIQVPPEAIDPVTWKAETRCSIHRMQLRSQVHRIADARINGAPVAITNKPDLLEAGDLLEIDLESIEGAQKGPSRLLIEGTRLEDAVRLVTSDVVTVPPMEEAKLILTVGEAFEPGGFTIDRIESGHAGLRVISAMGGLWPLLGFTRSGAPRPVPSEELQGRGSERHMHNRGRPYASGTPIEVQVHNPSDKALPFAFSVWGRRET